MKFLIALPIIILTNYCYSNNLFESNFYNISFISNDVENKKISKIRETKFISIDKILSNILINKDYQEIKKNLDEDLINIFIKNILIEEEKIINNNYSSKIKINFDKDRLIDYLRNKKISYVEYLPKEIFIIIYEKEDLIENLFSIKNKHYNYLINNNYFDNFYSIPNLDLNDRYLLSGKNIDNNNLEKIEKFITKYSKNDSLIIISNDDGKLINYSNYFYSSNDIIKLKDFKTNNYNYPILFKFLKNEFIQHWKLKNSINNKILNSINCDIKYFNLQELKQIKKNLNNISSIKNVKLKKMSLKSNLYKIEYFGEYKFLPKLSILNNLEMKIGEENCKISLK